MGNESIKLILFQCQGLGFQINESIDKLSSFVEARELQTETAYLLDDKGEILCTLLKDRDLYESGNNQDRRIQNSKNGFNIVWLYDGKGCCVYQMHKIKRRVFLVKPLFVGSVIALLCGLLLVFFLKEGVALSSLQNNLKKIESLEFDNKCLILQKDSLEKCIIKLNTAIAPYKELLRTDSINKDIMSQKEKLQSMSCDVKTVDIVRAWWHSLSENDKKIVLSAYNFDYALHVYSQFFNVRNKSDLYFLSEKSKSVLSARQRNLLMRIYKDDELKELSFYHKSFYDVEMLIKDYKKNERNI